MENSYRFFENKECEYFPCHDQKGHFNCLFCYCPMYWEKYCPGKPAYVEIKGKKVKDCSGCTFPHEPDNYDVIMKRLAE